MPGKNQKIRAKLSHVDRNAPQRLHRIHTEITPVCVHQFSNLGNRLNHMPVSLLASITRHHRRAGFRIVSIQNRLQRIHVDHSGLGDRNRVDLIALKPATFQHTRMLNGATI